MGKRVAFPKVFGEEMRFYEVSSFVEFTEGTFGVKEPPEENPVDWRCGRNALVLTPGVAFDRSGNRMGFGKGYYDRHFSGAHDCVMLGVAYELQVTDRLPAGRFDVPLPWLVTEDGIHHTEETMDYEAAMSFLKDTEKYGSRLGLDSIRSLMHELGDIQDKIPIVHIAGTNGKGSVGAMLSSVLAESGYLVGRFNTPDVFSYEEEFLMNGIPIERERLARLFTEVSEACERITKRGLPHPTRFEVESAAAFLWFYEEGFDIALAEVGLGGETDATNLIQKPLVSVLTSISMDHMSFLGDTLSEIAEAKAGIIKPGCPVVSVAQKPEVWDVICLKCGSADAELIPADVTQAGKVSRSEGELSFLWDMSAFSDGTGAGKESAEAFPCERTAQYHFPEDAASRGLSDLPVYEKIAPGLRGWFQLENAVCALRVLEVLKRRYPQISRAAVVNGLRKTRWPGRFEQIASAPDIFLDGAHNEDAVSKLRATLDLYFPDRREIFLMGVLADKDYDRMIRVMFHEGDRVFTLTPPNPRALSAYELASRLKKQNIDAVPCANARDAVSYALAEAGERDVILAFGSLSYLNGVREALREIRRLRE